MPHSLMSQTKDVPAQNQSLRRGRRFFCRPSSSAIARSSRDDFPSLSPPPLERFLPPL